MAGTGASLRSGPVGLRVAAGRSRRRHRRSRCCGSAGSCRPSSACTWESALWRAAPKATERLGVVRGDRRRAGATWGAPAPRLTRDHGAGSGSGARASLPGGPSRAPSRPRPQRRSGALSDRSRCRPAPVAVPRTPPCPHNPRAARHPAPSRLYGGFEVRRWAHRQVTQTPARPPDQRARNASASVQVYYPHRASMNSSIPPISFRHSNASRPSPTPMNSAAENGDDSSPM